MFRKIFSKIEKKNEIFFLRSETLDRLINVKNRFLIQFFSTSIRKRCPIFYTINSLPKIENSKFESKNDKKNVDFPKNLKIF